MSKLAELFLQEVQEWSSATTIENVPAPLKAEVEAKLAEINKAFEDEIAERDTEVTETE